MTIARLPRLAAILVLALALPMAAKDVYKCCLDPGNPQHKATLDILARLEETPNDASLHNDLGCLIARDGFWRDALSEFETAEKLDKKDGRAPYNAGLVQATRGEWGAARSAFKKAVDRNPGNWPAWWMLGFAEERLGNANAAVQAYAQSLRVDTSLFDVKSNPYALQSRLKARVLLETYDARFARAALPTTEQFAQPEMSTSFQTGRVAVAAAPGPVVAESPRPRPAAGPGGGSAAAVAGPAAGGAVVTSVPPVSASRPAPPAPIVSSPPPPARSGSLEEAPPWFPQTSPAGPAPAKTPRPAGNPDPGSPSAPAPTPPPAGPGVG